MTTARHPAAGLVPITTAARALGLEIVGRKARCFNGTGHRNGEDRHPSLVLFPDHGRFKCFACGVRGDAIDLVRGVLGVSFREAVAWIERLAGGTGPVPAGPSVCRPAARCGGPAAAEVYQALYTLAAPPAAASTAGRYLLGRGIMPQTAAAAGAREMIDAASVWSSLLERFALEQLQAAGLLSRRGGFLFARHALLFFYLDGDRPVFVQARDVTGTARAKEMGPAGMSCSLPFNINVLKTTADRVYVCEGCIDALSAVQLGHAAVGVPGVQAFRDDWFSLFRGVREVGLLFDTDEAGMRQGAELRSRFRMRGFQADAYHAARGKDVNDLLVALQKENQP